MSSQKRITVPGIGEFDSVEVIDILVRPGDRIVPEDPLITLESDKATMDIPAPEAGKVVKVLINSGDKVSRGTPILEIEPEDATEAAAKDVVPSAEEEKPKSEPQTPAPEPVQKKPPQPASAAKTGDEGGPHPPAPTAPRSIQATATQSSRAHASPSVRKFARELGVDLGLVRGSGCRGRILKQDVQSFTKAVMADQRMFRKQNGDLSFPQIPPVDFSKFGPVESKPLSRLRCIGARNLYRSWFNVPHVTQFDEADITDLEEFRLSRKKEAEKLGTRLTLLSFLIKAAVVALKEFPDFNSSMGADGEMLIMKRYFHIGFAVNTDAGLMVPVIRDADQKGLFDLAKELAELAEKAHDRKLTPSEMKGGCFTISSLGRIGGTGFTPIINVPEVAILGVARASWQPRYTDEGLKPRLILPFSLSYDHRVIDGVAGAELTSRLNQILSDVRQLIL